jgi:phosphoglycolate phosphatase-like HAD superfamily hydrolase
MKVLTLDFDGVLVNSVRELFLVALQSYLQENPTSALVHRKARDLYGPFLALMPLGNRAEDFGVLMAALDGGKVFEDQEDYDRFRMKQNPAWLDRYHARFYRVRETMATKDPAAWLELMQPYKSFMEVLCRRQGQATYAIATAKDRTSVDILLSDYGIADLFEDRLIMDKETGSSKAAHVQRLLELLGTDPGEMTFIDDKVNHLDSVAPLGARCALATWGYNGAREHELAIRRGYEMLTLDNVEAKLFGA